MAAKLAPTAMELSFAMLPQELLLHVFSFLADRGDARALCALARVCRLFCSLSQDKYLWRRCFATTFPDITVPSWKEKDLRESSIQILGNCIWKHLYFEAYFSAECINLTVRQQHALELVRSGKNVFITGSGGTGKSYLIHKIKELLIEQGKVFAITASTGLAAFHIGGRTLHSWACVGLAQTDEDYKMAWSKKERWREVETLIIDEISMISADLFEGLEALARSIRGNSLPFGGIQVIACGDFYQLPPVWRTTAPPSLEKSKLQIKSSSSDSVESKTQPPDPPRGPSGRFCFQSLAWDQCFPETVHLTTVIRQQDQQFLEILQDLRVGLVTPAAISQLEPCYQHHRVVSTANAQTTLNGEIIATRFFPTNREVDFINDAELARLPAEQHVLKASDEIEVVRHKRNGTPRAPEDIAESEMILQWHLNHCQARAQIFLKVDAQVMLVKNLSTSLVNGSRGVVVGWVPSNTVQLRLASTTTENNDEQQGNVVVIPNSVLHAMGREFLQRNQWLPVVRFDGEIMTVGPELFESVIPGDGTVARVQIPLRLAWAITIHKCQGMTLDKAEVSLRQVFSPGQTYVALSRVRSLQGLTLSEPFDPKCVWADPRVKQFYKKVVLTASRPRIPWWPPPKARKRTLPDSVDDDRPSKRLRVGADENDGALFELLCNASI